MTTRWIAVGLAFGALLLSTSASAQSAEGPSNDSPPPPCGFRERPCAYPHFAVALEGGVASFNEGNPFAFGTGIGAATLPGPSWGLRVGYEVKRWLAFDAHYVGMSDNGRASLNPTGSVSLFTSGALAEVRLTVPLSYVQPYFFTGAGVCSTSIRGTATARAGSPLFGSTEPDVPVGLGLGFPITHALTLGGEVTYHRFFGESFSADEEIGGGDLTTMNAVVRGHI